MELVYGKPIADAILDEICENVHAEKVRVGFAVVLVGDNKASHLYVNLKAKAAEKVGIVFNKILLPADVDENILLQTVQKLNADESVHGIIVQLPLPKGFHTQRVINAIDPEKDVDGFHPKNTALFLKGTPMFVPVFPAAIMRLIENTGELLIGKKAIVVANSKKFGEIMVAALQQKQISAKYVLSKELQDYMDELYDADIVVTAVGKAGLIRASMVKENTVIIDGGISTKKGEIKGDVDQEGFETCLGYLTPVPGGVGPVTIACLLENVFRAFKAQQKEKQG